MQASLIFKTKNQGVINLNFKCVKISWHTQDTEESGSNDTWSLVTAPDFHTPEPSGTWPVCMHQSQISDEFILLAATHSAEREEAKNISLP